MPYLSMECVPILKQVTKIGTLQGFGSSGIFEDRGDMAVGQYVAVCMIPGLVCLNSSRSCYIQETSERHIKLVSNCREIN